MKLILMLYLIGCIAMIFTLIYTYFKYNEFIGKNDILPFFISIFFSWFGVFKMIIFFIEEEEE